jgi:UDP-GlcNAc:undecaprenyl-phosphate/decaprenyl-phosphate GlcNAc-1-phosphate transferase
MRLMITAKCLAVLAVGCLVAPLSAQEPSALKTQKDKVSYSIGVSVGKGMKQQGIDIDADALAKGLRDAISGGNLLMTEEEIHATLTAFDNEFKAKREKAARSAGDDNKKAGESFLAENKTKEGVVTLPSGLQYKIIKAGNGKKPTDADTVQCHYKGTLIDGTKFDSSYDRGQPASFPVAGVIPGWTEALKLMPVGSKWLLVVPSRLAYGEHGQGPVIGPNATLVFEVELLGIK